jgi:SnoaL-like protein
MTQSDLSKRTPQEVFGHHGQALGAEDVDGILADYTDTSYLVSPSGVLRGKSAIRGFFEDLIRAVPQAKWNLKTTYVEDILFLEWTADSTKGSVSDGVDTFIFKDGMIHIQTVRATIVPKA